MIQQVEKSTTVVSGGFNKQIDKGALPLIIDIVQSDQYQKPYESVVRELTSNAKDAVDEKKIARSILTGKSKVEDHYIHREGDLYKSSNWNPDYYDLECLSDNDIVELLYQENYTKTDIGYCDMFSVKDYGVGLGEDRILGFTSLGYSTKRNTQTALGNFGLGAKVGLATGVDSFLVESVHNGKRIILQIFNYQVVSNIGPINLITGEANGCYEFEVDGKSFCVHYENTTEKNYTKISVPCKKSGRQKIAKAIKDVLPYVKGITWTIMDEDGTEHLQNFQPEIQYESEILLVTNNNRWDRVRVGVVKKLGQQKHDVIISYGVIDFDEMGISEKTGAVTIKCPVRSVLRHDNGTETVLQEGIDIIP